jgi:APA family basic amino acid/polyamine antiporter
MAADPRSSNISPQLVRAIGRWSMVALALNSILGSGIFGLPSPVAAQLGSASPVAVLLAGAGSAVIIACYAELASQFTASGGTYLYVRHAFGRLTGLQVAWLALLSRLTACAAAVNLLVTYLGEFWPQATQRLPRLTVILLFIGTLAAVNVRGVRAGTWVSNVAVIAKISALGLVCIAGVLYLSRHAAVAPVPVPASLGSWLDAMLLLLFAFGGYEAALNPMGEAKHPRRDVAFALFAALAILVVLYALLQWVVMGVLTDPAHSSRPLAAAARVFTGDFGAGFISVAALVSVYGYVGANMQTVPRSMFALAEGGDFPQMFAAVHPRFRTPHVAILVFAVLVAGFSLIATFTWNVTLSAVARLFYYGASCVAVPVLRARQPRAALFRVPGGPLLPVLGVLICLALLTRVDFSNSVIVLVTVVTAFGNWLAVRHTSRAAPSVRSDGA